MYFESMSELLRMDGHGIYVWSVFVVALVILASQVMIPVVKVRQFWRNEEQRQKRMQTANSHVSKGA